MPGPCLGVAANYPVPSNVRPDEFNNTIMAITATYPTGGFQPLPQAIQKIAAALAATAVAGVSAAILAQAVRECLKSPGLAFLAPSKNPFLHPCEKYPMYSPGSDVPQATEHRFDAIFPLVGGNPARAINRWSTLTEREARKLRVPPLREGWYRLGGGVPPCTPAGKTAAETKYGTPNVQCDEFPNWAMQAAGPGASLRCMPTNPNSVEGNNLKTFAGKCPKVSNEAVPPLQREQFIVVPRPLAIGVPTLSTSGT